MVVFYYFSSITVATVASVRGGNGITSILRKLRAVVFFGVMPPFFCDVSLGSSTEMSR